MPILSILNKGLHPFSTTQLMCMHYEGLKGLWILPLLPSTQSISPSLYRVNEKINMSNIISFFTLPRLTLTLQRSSLMSFYAHLYFNRHNSKQVRTAKVFTNDILMTFWRLHRSQVGLHNHQHQRAQMSIQTFVEFTYTGCTFVVPLEWSNRTKLY